MKAINFMRACFFAGLFLSQQAAAQQSPFSLGLRAGLNLSNANETIDYLDGKIGPKLGYQGGVTSNTSCISAFACSRASL
ncbi:hypothetical protein J2T02_001996 [Chitinophaga terrae (ex Kim and Jung 2007)]|uniref:hypothetical protein n=1 Tax=Chitinophaga terrae (ex Kim and Jung 2007) TaxID=408074 RepID=UPI0027829FD1|nr:hypothetical protein [Chitinophaga terrae (ex Kim and Jung 2007)]MDQ0106883.1 hypothetical protein [Chitinophaga terrae (ex Kim and Jung 2007)]